MADDKADTIVDQAVGDTDGLLGIADVIVFNADQFLAHDPAIGVDLLDGHAGAGKLHVAILGDRAGHGAGDADLDFGGGVAGAHQGDGGADSGYQFLN